MTYNFDPDRWYEAHRAAIETRRGRGELDEAEHARLIEELDRRYDEMVARLDGTYRIPPGSTDD
jgi:hypothetical protein